jgi:hypothetical protein
MCSSGYLIGSLQRDARQSWRQPHEPDQRRPLARDRGCGNADAVPRRILVHIIEQRADPDTIYRDAGYDAITGDLGDGGFVVNWTPGDGPTGETSGIIAIITPAENDGSSQGIITDWRTSGPGDELAAGLCATGQTCEQSHVGSEGNAGFVVIGGIVIDRTPGDSSAHDAFPTETVFPTETIAKLTLRNGARIIEKTWPAELQKRGATQGKVAPSRDQKRSRGDSFPTANHPRPILSQIWVFRRLGPTTDASPAEAASKRTCH